MIYWYSGTGNSLYVAEELAEGLNDSPISFIPFELRPDRNNSDKSAADSSCLGIVFPVYAWGVPPIVLKWADTLDSDLLKGKYVYAVCTCGDEAGMAIEMLRSHLGKKEISLNAAFSVIMPNNYVLMPGFTVDPKKVEEKKLSRCRQRIMEITDIIRKRIETTDVFKGSMPRFKTRLIYPIFKAIGIQSNRWRSSGACTGCGKCSLVCPAHNIKMSDDRKPMWGKNCLSCTACYHICPVNAISYGKVAEGKRQYICPLSNPINHI